MFLILRFAAGRNKNVEEGVDTWAISEVERFAAIHFQMFGPNEHISTFPFLLACVLVLSHLQASQKPLFCFLCFSRDLFREKPSFLALVAQNGYVPLPSTY